MDARSIADTLIAAERERKAIAPFTDAAPGLDAGTAYQAQRMVVQHRLDGGERIIGAVQPVLDHHPLRLVAGPGI